MKLGRKGYTLIELLAAMLILIMFMGVLASFYLNITKSAATSRRAAWAGQAVERALSILRQELAGATEIERVGTDQLYYRRIRDDTYWLIMIEDGNLIRRSNADPGTEVMIAKNVDSFEFILPQENLDEFGFMIDPNIIWVIVGAGNFKLDDAIYLRNYIE